MGSADGRVIGVTQVVNNGPPSRRWNLAVMGDGYTETELPAFTTDVDALVAKIRVTKPFDNVWRAVNVFRVDVVSAESGADNPHVCPDDRADTPVPPVSTRPKTFFNARFCSGEPNPVRRLLTVDERIALDTSLAYVPQRRMTMVIVNSTYYGGSGGSVAVYSRAPSATEIALHEMGHTAFHLADEYEYYQGCDSGETDHNTYAGGVDPGEPNVSANADKKKIKWRALLTTGVDLPTTKNPDCAQCDGRASPVPLGTVGAFEGAQYFHCGLYRPEADCRMRTLNQEFCAVCQDAIKKEILRVSPGA